MFTSALYESNIPSRISEIAVNQLTGTTEFLEKYRATQYIDKFSSVYAELAINQKQIAKIDLNLEGNIYEACQSIAMQQLDKNNFLRTMFFAGLPTLFEDLLKCNKKFFPSLSQEKSEAISLEVCKLAASCIIARGTETAVIDILPYTGYPPARKHKDGPLINEGSEEFHASFNLGGNKSTLFLLEELTISALVGEGVFFKGASKKAILHSSPEPNDQPRYTVIITPCSHTGAYNYLQFMQKLAVKELLTSPEAYVEHVFKQRMIKQFDSYKSPFGKLSYPSVEAELFSFIIRDAAQAYAINENFRSKVAALDIFLQPQRGAF